MKNEKKPEETKEKEQILFIFTDKGIRQELVAVDSNKMLTAAAILLAQVIKFEEDGRTKRGDTEKQIAAVRDEMTDTFKNGYLEEALKQDIKIGDSREDTADEPDSQG